MKISNSKKQLAKIIRENGGWREGNYAIQDKDDKCVWFMFELKGRPNGRAFWPGVKSKRIGSTVLLPNWHQTILSRDEYFHLHPVPDADGWIEWKGGECPVNGDDDVEVVLVDGSIDYGIANEFDWHIDGGPLSVASYRLCNIDSDEWLNWCGGECPVDDGVLIDVKKVDGSAELAVHDPQDRIWSDLEHRKCITAYRLHKPDVKPEFCESVMRSIPGLGINSKNININITQVDDINVVESKPTIEQLAADYRNLKDFADRKQEEAKAAKADAKAKLAELVAAGKALGLALSVAGADSEPEQVIINWRDLRVGDVVWYGGDDELSPGEYHVMEIEVPDYEGYRTVLVNDDSGGHWIDTRVKWGLIRRPT